MLWFRPSQINDSHAGQIEPLEQMIEIQNPITATLDDLDLIVESFHETAGIALDEVVGDLIDVSRYTPADPVSTNAAAAAAGHGRSPPRSSVRSTDTSNRDTSNSTSTSNRGQTTIK